MSTPIQSDDTRDERAYDERIYDERIYDEPAYDEPDEVKLTHDKRVDDEPDYDEANYNEQTDDNHRTYQHRTYEERPHSTRLRDRLPREERLSWLKRDAALDALQDAAERMRTQTGPLQYPDQRGRDPLVPRALRAIEPYSEGNIAIRRFGRFAATVLAAVAIAGVYVLAEDSLSQGKLAVHQARLWGVLGGQPAEPSREVEKIPPRLAVEGSRGEVNQPMGLNIDLQRAPANAVVVVTGLVSSTQLTAGAAAGPNSWNIPARDIANLEIVPPTDFVGPMELAVELRLADASIVDRKMAKVEWVAARETQGAAPTPSPPPSPIVRQPVPSVPAAQAPRALESEEIVNLVKRGEAYLESGDLAAARLVLQRAAEAGNARAAFALGASFDPRVIKESGLIGAVPDPARARAWYEKAKEFGSREAPQRLEQLAQTR